MLVTALFILGACIFALLAILLRRKGSPLSSRELTEKWIKKVERRAKSRDETNKFL